MQNPKINSLLLQLQNYFSNYIIEEHIQKKINTIIEEILSLRKKEPYTFVPSSQEQIRQTLELEMEDEKNDF